MFERCKQFLIFLFFGITSVKARAAEGVRFDEISLNWEQVLAKATAEKKLIFVDCYATWCGPCMAMAEGAFRSEKVGGFINSHFISLKLQMDSTSRDTQQVKAWYSIARKMMQLYRITAFPTFLFFSSDGKIIHREVGFKSDDVFIRILEDALDSHRQFYTLKTNYQRGKKDYTSMLYLIGLAHKFGDKELETSASSDYLHYLDQLKDDKLYTKENFEFLARNLKSSKEKAFTIFYQQREKIDDLFQKKKVAESVADNIIFQEYVFPYLWIKDSPIVKNPDWAKLQKTIAQTFNQEYAARVILNAKIRWFTLLQDWKEIVKYRIMKLEKEGIDTSLAGIQTANNIMYLIIFQHSDDTITLQKGLVWEKEILTLYPYEGSYLDTYANLLYKLGKYDDAMTWEQRAVKLDGDMVTEIKANYEKMKKHQPTWPKQL